MTTASRGGLQQLAVVRVKAPLSAFLRAPLGMIHIVLPQIAKRVDAAVAMFEKSRQHLIPRLPKPMKPRLTRSLAPSTRE